MLYRQIRPYTMSSNARLRSLYRSIQNVIQKGIEGDLVECGCAKGEAPQ